MHGIKKVFKETYFNNINLYEKIEKHNQTTNILNKIELQELKREKLNEFYKTFKEINVNASKILQFKRMIKKFKALPQAEKLQHKRIGKKPLLKYINDIYSEYKNLQKANSNSPDEKVTSISLMDCIFKQISLNYGNIGVTDTRCFRLFASVVFNCVHHD